jgi:hypothetical protein
MAHYLIFERSIGHCNTMLYQAPCLRDALTAYAVNNCGALILDDGTLTDSDGNTYSHPLAMIESMVKSNRHYDELQLDAGGENVINQESWEIRELPREALAAPSADIFCSSYPWSLAEYIGLCRPVFRRTYPRSRALAFVWDFVSGPLVTFYKPTDRNYRRPIEVLGRYFIPWEPEHYPNPYPLSQLKVQEWHGTHQDIVDQMRIRYPF